MKNTSLWLGIGLCGRLLLAGQPVAAQGLAFTTNTYPVGLKPAAIAVTAITGQGGPDLITANAAANTLTVLTNNGGGIFGSNATLAVGLEPEFVAAGDLNGTGKPVLVCANFTDGSLTVLTNNGGGIFGSNATLRAYGSPIGLALADLYGNGRLDLICANDDDNLILFTNTGPAGFNPIPPASYGVGNGLAWVVAADVNGDGHPDLITANAADNTLSVLTNNGAGSFTTAATLAVGTNPVCVAAADINGDGRVDLVSANELGKTVTVLTNNGLGGFGSNATLHLSGNPTALVLADLTGDGKPDLAVTVASLISSIQVFTNNGSGRFGSNTTIFLPPQGSIVAAGVNGSGRNALITANATGNQLTVLTPTGPGRPLLRISRPAAHSFVLSWVSAQTNFVLQTNNNLASTNWFPGNYPVSINGSNQSSTLTAPPPGRLFFRLAQ